MSKPFLKDSGSKQKLHNWLIQGIKRYSASSLSYWADEDFLCGHFFSSISGLCSLDLGDFSISTLKLRGRGPSAPEKKLGADGLGIIDLKYPNIALNGFFLYQAKKAEQLSDSLVKAKGECDIMLTHTPASYLLVLMPSDIKMVGAMAVSANIKKSPCLNDLPYVNYSRFVIEHILHGIMIEPYDKLRSTLSTYLHAEIKNISIIVGGSRERIKEAENAIKQDLSSIDWQIDDQEKDLENER